jgi:hypothetical protein
MKNNCEIPHADGVTDERRTATDVAGYPPRDKTRFLEKVRSNGFGVHPESLPVSN